MSEASLGRAVALNALAPIAERLADLREREEAEEGRRRQLEEELRKLPELPRPERPLQPAPAGFSFDILVGVAFWGEVVSLAFVGPFLLGPLVFGKKFTESGYPWLLLLVAPIAIAVLAGCWPMIEGSSVRARNRLEMEAYEKAIREAEQRKLQRAKVQAKYEGHSR